MPRNISLHTSLEENIQFLPVEYDENEQTKSDAEDDPLAPPEDQTANESQNNEPQNNNMHTQNDSAAAETSTKEEGFVNGCVDG